MVFETKKIRDEEPGDGSNHRHHKVKIVTLAAGIAIITLLVIGVVSAIKSLNFSSIIFSFGQTLKADENGHTNILLAGVGGEGHDGSDLTDTLIVASVDSKQNLVSMLSIPRDLYIKTKAFKAGERINVVYSTTKSSSTPEQGMETLKEVASEIAGIPIDYYVKIDFDGFKKIVDSLGGIDVVVEKDIYDSTYPLGETVQYQTFALSAGPQHLDGDTALKYARSRHGKGNEAGDFDRARRQQQVITAVKEKALSLNILTNAGKIKALFDTVQSSIQTNFSINEIIELARIGKDFKRENMISYVLNDDPNSCGGFLYTPPREDFNGASVLLPVGKNYDYLHNLTNVLFKDPQLLKDQTPIQILNGTKKPNVALEVMNLLNRSCFNVNHIGNATNRESATSTIYYLPGPKGEIPATVDYISKLLPYPVKPGIAPEYLDSERTQDTQIVVELGADYLENRIQDPFYALPAPAPAASTSTQIPNPKLNSKDQTQ